ncbi:MAG: twin-arginine translocase subunit TatC [Elusimicrobiota bacterium]|nr:twin-arginine translocase subunit TatC [Elusimicrobiota bacterium]
MSGRELLTPEPLPEEAEAARMPFWEHVGELRGRLIRAVSALALGTAAAYALRFELWRLAIAPLERALAPYGVTASAAFAFTDLVEPFVVFLRLSFWSAAFLVSPFLFLQVWGFVRPALRESERRYASTFVVTTSVCFVSGALFAYFVLFPLLSDLLLAEAVRAGLRANLKPEPYLDLFLYTVVGTGACFEAPVLFFFLGRWGFVTPGGMLARWREASVVILAASAFFTPGDALTTTVVFGGVLLALYFVSVLVVAAARRSN